MRKKPVSTRTLVQRLRSQAEEMRQQGELVAALRTMDRIIQLNQATAEDWRQTGVLLCEVGEFAQSLGAFRHALQIKPDCIASQYDLGRAYYKLGNADQAAQLLEQAAQATDNVDMWMGLATIAPGVPSLDHPTVRSIREKFAMLVRKSESPLLGPASIRRTQAEKLRIAYVSAHWQDANYMKPVWPLINAHQMNNMDVLILDDSPGHSGHWDWLTNKTVQIHGLASLGNRQAAEAIRSLDVDVVIDLSAYSKPERLGMYVHQPAPIQVAWFNMYATSGFDEFHYIIGDPTVMRSAEQQYYCEKFLALPISYLTFQSNHPTPDIIERPPIGSVPFSFGCLGTQYKITPQVLDVWCMILRAADSSTLLLANRELKSKHNRQWLNDQIAARQVDPSRIHILPPVQHFDFLAYYDQIDLALDTFPYNGGTTTMEAIWQGVPLLTFSGDRWASRTSHSILAQSPLSDLVALDLEGYIRTAIEFATIPSKRESLRELRPVLRQQLQVSEACNSKRLAIEMETLYRSIVARNRPM